MAATMRKKAGIQDWTNLQYFLTVAQSGSFQAAAKILQTNQTTVARRMHRFETELDTKLFDRHAHGMRLTDSGEVAFKKLGTISDAVTDVEKNLVGLQTKESGLVTLAINDGIGSHWLLSTLPEFYARFPEINLRIKTNEKSLDLLSHDADISLQLERPEALRMVAFRASNLTHRLYVSSHYLARKGMPEKLADLKDHEVIDHEPYRSKSYADWWVKKVLAIARIRLSCNSANILLAATRRGIGIGLFPAFYAHTAPDLIPVPIAVPSVCQLWVVTHEETNKSRKVQAVVGFLRDRFQSDRELWFPLQR
jgi:DNA-binding transcriptional LysR family regulator